MSLVTCQSQRSFFTGGGCSSIPGVGAPVLMISHAHKFINDALNSNNPHSAMEFVYFEETSVNSNGNSTIILIFQLSSYKVTYFGIKIDNTNTMTTHQLIKHDNINTLGDVFKVDNLAEKIDSIECGDLKFIFSSYGQKPTSDLPFTSFGRNMNSASLDFLSRVQITHGQIVNGRIPKVCSSKNFTMERLYSGLWTVPTDFESSFECTNGSTVTPVHKLRFVCTLNGTTTTSTSSGPPSGLRYMQVIFNDPSGIGTFEGEEFGDTTFPESDVTEINIDQAAQIHFLQRNFNGSGTDSRGWEIMTKRNDGTIIDQYGCNRTNGLGGGPVTVANSTNDHLVDTYDFLGFGFISIEPTSLISLYPQIYDP